MIIKKNITLAEYSNLDDKTDYDFLIKYAYRFLNPVDEYNVGDVFEMPFGFVKDFQYELEQGLTNIKLFEFILKATGKKNISNEPLDKIYRFGNYLIDGVTAIIQLESNTLVSELTEKEISAGIDRFKDLGIYAQIRSLTNGDVTRYDNVRTVSYSICYLELYYKKQLRDYESDLIKLK